MWTVICEVSLEMEGRMEEECFLKGNPAPACLKGGLCHRLQADNEAGWWWGCSEPTSFHLCVPAQIQNVRKQATINGNFSVPHRVCFQRDPCKGEITRSSCHFKGFLFCFVFGFEHLDSLNPNDNLVLCVKIESENSFHYTAGCRGHGWWLLPLWASVGWAV